eukprot:COSAG01_NODE_123_length_25210_cov_348.799434_19_plen_40_part_00
MVPKNMLEGGHAWVHERLIAARIITVMMVCVVSCVRRFG